MCLLKQTRSFLRHMRAACSCCLRLHQWVFPAPSVQVENSLSKMNRKWKSFTSVAWRRLFCKYNCTFFFFLNPCGECANKPRTERTMFTIVLSCCNSCFLKQCFWQCVSSLPNIVNHLSSTFFLPSAELRSEIFCWSFKSHVVGVKNSLTCQNHESYVWNYFPYGFWPSFGGKIWQVTFHEITCFFQLVPIREMPGFTCFITPQTSITYQKRKILWQEKCWSLVILG